jgi:large subunit ribosomal protein L15
VPAGFEGGQTPAHIVAGERGFENVFSAELSPVNLNRVQQWIDKGKLPKAGDGVVTVRELVKSRCIHGTGKDGVKLLARGLEELRDPVNFVVSRASKAAIEAVEMAGGSVVTRYYSPFATKKVIGGEMDPIHSLASRIQIPGQSEQQGKIDWAAKAEDLVRNKNGYKYRLPDPLSRKALEYYRDPAKRGYLSYQVPEGESPSLFFKTPTEGLQKRAVKKSGSVGGRANKMW